MEEKKVYSFFNVKTQNQGVFEEEFNITYNEDGTFRAVSKNTYQCEVGNKEINYRIGVAMVDINEAGEDSDKKIVYATIVLIPSFDCLCEQIRNQIMKRFDYTDTESMSYYDNAMTDGYCVSLEHDEFYYTEEPKWQITGYADFKEVIGTIAATYNVFASFVGFYLDKRAYQNINGWDRLKSLCH